jgi:hypothetical protein
VGSNPVVFPPGPVPNTAGIEIRLTGGDPGQTVKLKIGIGDPGCCPTDFAITNLSDCTGLHLSGQKCFLAMQFNPTQPFDEDATVQIIAFDAQGGQVPTTFQLSGTGTGGLG